MVKSKEKELSLTLNLCTIQLCTKEKKKEKAHKDKFRGLSRPEQNFYNMNKPLTWTLKEWEYISSSFFF